MELISWQTVYRKKNTSKRNKLHPEDPYSLKGLDINRANQVRAIDITHVPMAEVLCIWLQSLMCIHATVINWSLSNTMTAEWCRMVVEEAIELLWSTRNHKLRSGSQFTSYEYTSLLLERENQ
ncbi:MAG: hypothetical protein IPO32_19655 [Crocinitomicaceae bacterium]|nr:hypothetical protein [Crocinitomicaceae bacterium]